MKITCIELDGSVRTREYHESGYSETFSPAKSKVCEICNGTGKLVDKEDWTGGVYDCVCQDDTGDDQQEEIYENEKIEDVMWGYKHDPVPYENWRI